MIFINWKKSIIVLLDVVLAVYLLLAVTSFNVPNEGNKLCDKVTIDISDSNNVGFLSAGEIKKILSAKGLYPYMKPIDKVSPRNIEETLKVTPFVKSAECYKTIDGQVCITITQRTPIVRIISNNGADYYIDERGGQLPNSNYSSDLIIATGYISRNFARQSIAPLAKTIMDSPLWSNQIVQINVLPNKSIELVPRVGNHIVCLGQLPEESLVSVQQDSIVSFTLRKLERLEKFYRYGLSVAGWDKYKYIDIEFDNQIICKRKE